MIARAITYFGKPCIIACDSRCDKAWGLNGRPRKRFSATDWGSPSEGVTDGK